MKIITQLSALTAAALTLSACNPEPEGKPVLRTEIGSGVAEKAAVEEVATTEPEARPSACKDIEFEGVTLTDCVADPAQHTISLALGPKGGAPYRSLANLAASRAPDAPLIAFAVNAGMFDKEGKPIGYYVENGVRTKELNRADGPGNFHLKPNGVFFGSKGKWRILGSNSFYSTVGDRPQFGTQSGPMLVIDGKLHPEIAENGPSKAIRNGVGIDKSGKAHFVISKSPISFGVLARFYRDQLKTPNALFLDGNVSALWDPATERLDNGAPIGPMIVVEAKN